jgi:hypothetical protein
VPDEAAPGVRITLKNDVVTRWTSELLMIRSFTRNLKAIRLFWDAHPSLRIDESGVQLLQDIELVLSVPGEVSEFCEKQHSVTAIAAWEVVWSVVSCLRAKVKPATAAGKGFLEELILQWRIRTNANFERCPAARMCFFLNPSIWGSSVNAAGDGFTFAAEKFFEINEMHLKNVPNLVARTFQTFCNGLQSLALKEMALYVPSQDNVDERPAIQTLSESGAKKRGILLDHLHSFRTESTVGYERGNRDAELLHYCKNRSYNASAQMGILDYFATKVAAEYPNVLRLAKRYLCIPASNVTSESLWSLAGTISEDERSNTSHQLLEAQLMVRRNFQTIELMETLIRESSTGDESNKKRSQ